MDDSVSSVEKSTYGETVRLRQRKRGMIHPRTITTAVAQ